ncbi:MAG TPA: glycosyltransferase family 2 protein [Methanoculleus sp.]|jgi:glycosyltransferase involved in cell wall biosynthesis|nr:glycosyltransferase family 2 protein [Methanoculleus sp.]MBP8676435.1 glycosyltransferase family 2 protein [Methanoculleus sp.]HON40344.1 glycosyltransferase family 2 protein [Methanoculleus sp.]
MAEIEVSAVLPVYNDLAALRIAIPRSLETLEEIAPGRFELIVAEDGSTDGSADFVREYEARDPRVRLLHADERLGRGRALNRAFAAARGSIVCYYDVDLATDMQHLAELIGSVREGYDIATGSRLLPGSTITRSGGREIASRGYNMLVRLILRSRLHDHQCGFKAFRRGRLLSLLPSVTADHWFWDTEVLVRAQRKDYRIRELPVRWRQGEGTTVRAKDVVEMGSAIVHLWWRLHVEKN